MGFSNAVERPGQRYFLLLLEPNQYPSLLSCFWQRTRDKSPLEPRGFALLASRYIRQRMRQMRLTPVPSAPPVLHLPPRKSCLLYTSDAADDLLCVDLGGRRI